MTQKTKAERETLDLKDAAARLGVGINTVRRAIADGTLAAIRLKRRVLIKRTSFDRLLADSAVRPE